MSSNRISPEASRKTPTRMAAASATSGGLIPSARNCQLLRHLQIQNVWPEQVAAMLGGETTARTLPEIAKAFGVGLSTVKQWSQMGMPKPEKRGELYDLIDILDWRLMEDRRADEDPHHYGKR